MNHAGRWLLAVGVGGLAACTVPDLSKLGPYACEDSSSCAPGYSCVQGVCSTSPGDQPPPPPSGGDVDSGTPDSEGRDSGVPDSGSLDTTPPILTLIMPSPQNMDPVGKTTYSEPGPDGGVLPPAWRRDQVVTVGLYSDSTLPLTLVLTGTDGVAVPVDVVPFTSGCNSPQCAQAQLPLWKPRLDAERGTLTFTATAKDEAGNTTVQKGSLPVTRWKWAYDVFDASAMDAIDATPAIGAKGTVYVTTYNSSLIALTPEGRELWVKPGGAEGTVVVGNPGDGREILYARLYWSTTRYMGDQLIVYDAASAASGSPLLMCPETHINNTDINNYALGNPGTASEGVVASTNGSASGMFLGLSASGNSGSPQCTTASTSLKDAGRGNTVLRNGVLFFTGPGDDATSVTVGSATARTGWPVSSVADGANGMALVTLGGSSTDTLVMGEGDLTNPTGSSGGISAVSAAGGMATLKYSGGPVASPVVGSGNIAYGVDARSGQLVRVLLSASGSPVLSQENTLDSTLSPTLGQGGLVYAMFPSEVGVWSASNLSLRWRWSVGSVPTTAKRVAPGLDCTRNAQGVPIAGQPGVLYASIHNRLYALVVDSAGLDADAPWPKYQHDERNTGNPSVSTLRCP